MTIRILKEKVKIIMGMAASQARLLSITSRMADNELRAQIANNAKMRLASDSSRVSADYVNALNDATMMITNYDEAGKSQYDKLTFNRLTQYSPFNTQYGLANTYGQLLVNENEAKIFEAAGGSLNKYLEAHGLEFSTSYFNSEAFNGASVITFDDEKGNNLGNFTLEDLKTMYFGGTAKNSDGVDVAHRGYLDNEDMYESFNRETTVFANKYKSAMQDENIMALIDAEIYAFGGTTYEESSSSYLSTTRNDAIQNLRRIYSDSSDFSAAGITENNGANKLAQVLDLINDMSGDVDLTEFTDGHDKMVKGAVYDYYNEIYNDYFKTVEKVDAAGNTVMGPDGKPVMETVLKDLVDFNFRVTNLNGREVCEEGQYINGEWAPCTSAVTTYEYLSENETKIGHVTYKNDGILNPDNIEDTWDHWDGALWKTNYMWHDEPSDSTVINALSGVTQSNTYAIPVTMISTYTQNNDYQKGLRPGYVYLSKVGNNVMFFYGQNNSDDSCGTYADLGTNYGSFVDKRAGKNGIYEIDIAGQCNGLTVEYDDTLVYFLEGGTSGAVTSNQFLETNISTDNLKAAITREQLYEILGIKYTEADAVSGAPLPAGALESSVITEYQLLIKRYNDSKADYEADIQTLVNRDTSDKSASDKRNDAISKITAEPSSSGDHDYPDYYAHYKSMVFAEDQMKALTPELKTYLHDVKGYNTSGITTNPVSEAQLNAVLTANGYKSPVEAAASPTVYEYLQILEQFEKWSNTYNSEFDKCVAKRGSAESASQWINSGWKRFWYGSPYTTAYYAQEQMLKYNEDLLKKKDGLMDELKRLGYDVSNSIPTTLKNAFIFTENNQHTNTTGKKEEYHNFGWITGEYQNADGTSGTQKYFIVDPQGFYVTNDKNVPNGRDASLANNMKGYAFEAAGPNKGQLREHTFFTKEQAYFYIIQNLVQDAFGQYEEEDGVIKDAKGAFRYSVNLMVYLKDEDLKTGNAKSDALLDDLREENDKIEENFGIDLSDTTSTDFGYIGSYIDQLKENIEIGSRPDATPEQKKAAEAAKAIYDNYILNCLFDVYGEPNITWIDKNNPEGDADAKVNWYTNLFERLSKGYKVLEDGLANSNEWIQYALESGICAIEQVDQFNHWNGTVYTNVATITEVTDQVAVAKAEADYKKAMNQIENKDKRLDIELKNIDTEHNALQSEYETIKGVISKNVERTFKMYS